MIWRHIQNEVLVVKLAKSGKKLSISTKDLIFINYLEFEIDAEIPLKLESVRENNTLKIKFVMEDGNDQ